MLSRGMEMGCAAEVSKSSMIIRQPGAYSSSLVLQVFCGVTGHQGRDPSWGRHVLGSLHCCCHSQGSWFIPWQ